MKPVTKVAIGSSLLVLGSTSVAGGMEIIRNKIASETVYNQLLYGVAPKDSEFYSWDQDDSYATETSVSNIT